MTTNVVLTFLRGARTSSKIVFHLNFHVVGNLIMHILDVDFLVQLQEWESTSRSLKADIAGLHRSMGELREMMDTCIQMQLELQRSIRQEVSGALQRMYIGKGVILYLKTFQLF